MKCGSRRAGVPPAPVLLKPVPALSSHNAQHDLVFVQHKLHRLSTGFQQVSMQPRFWLHNMPDITCLPFQSVGQSSNVAEHCSSQAQTDWALVMLTQVQAQHSLDAECDQELQAPKRTVANSPATQQESVQAPNRAVANTPATQPNSKQVRTCFGTCVGKSADNTPLSVLCI